jgi:hypothetical protein
MLWISACRTTLPSPSLLQLSKPRLVPVPPDADVAVAMDTPRSAAISRMLSQRASLVIPRLSIAVGTISRARVMVLPT